MDMSDTIAQEERVTTLGRRTGLSAEVLRSLPSDRLVDYFKRSADLNEGSPDELAAAVALMGGLTGMVTGNLVLGLGGLAVCASLVPDILRDRKAMGSNQGVRREIETILQLSPS